MDAEDREMFRDFKTDMKEGFTGVHKRVNEVQTAFNLSQTEQALLNQRLTAHVEDNSRHRNPEQELREQRERKQQANGSWPEWLTIKLIVSVGLGIGAVIAGIVGALVM